MTWQLASGANDLADTDGMVDTPFVLHAATHQAALDTGDLAAGGSFTMGPFAQQQQQQQQQHHWLSTGDSVNGIVRQYGQQQQQQQQQQQLSSIGSSSRLQRFKHGRVRASCWPLQRAHVGAPGVCSGGINVVLLQLLRQHRCGRIPVPALGWGTQSSR